MNTPALQISVSRRQALQTLALPAAAAALSPWSALAQTGGTPHDATELGAVLSDALAAIKRRSVVFVVSDFISLPGWDQALSQLARRHDVRLADVQQAALEADSARPSRRRGKP